MNKKSHNKARAKHFCLHCAVLLLVCSIIVQLVGCDSEQDKKYDELVYGSSLESQEDSTPKPGETPKKLNGELTISLPKSDSTLELWASRFQRANPGVKVHIETVSFNPDSGTGDWVTDYMRKTVVDLGSGSAADIVDLRLVSFYKYAKSGLFEDLYPYMDEDPGFDRECLYANILKAVESDTGELYALPPFFEYDTFVLNDYIMYDLGVDVDKKYPDGLDYRDIISLYWQARDAGIIDETCCFAKGQNKLFFDDFVLPGYLDDRGMKASFDTPEYLEYLSLMDALPFEKKVTSQASYEFNWPQFGTSDYFCQRYPVKIDCIGTMDFKGGCGATGVQFYKGEGGKVLFSPRNLLAITSGSQNKELAWEFLKFMVQDRDFPDSVNFSDTDEVQAYGVPYDMCLPVNRNNFMKLSTAAAGEFYTEKYDAYNQSLNTIMPGNAGLIRSMKDILAAFYDNHLISAEECGKQLQERADLYLKE